MINKFISPFTPKKIIDVRPSTFKIYTFNAGYKKFKHDLLIVVFEQPVKISAVFTAENYQDLKKKDELINKSILEIGFENTANIYGISGSSKLGGKVGWVNESQLNKVIKKEIINLNVNEHTKPITIPGGFLILKLDDKKKDKIKINFDQEFNKQISNEKDVQLQQFSEIYFKKIKKNSTISEK